MWVRNPSREPCEVDRGRMLAGGEKINVKERDPEVARKLKSGRLRRVSPSQTQSPTVEKSAVEAPAQTQEDREVQDG